MSAGQHVTPLTCCCPGTAAAAAAAAVGAFDTLEATYIKTGDKIVILANPADASAGFQVTSVVSSTAEYVAGFILPFVEMPYVIADGVIVPL